MAEAATESNSETEYGFKKLKEHIALHLMDFVLWVLRVCAVLLTIGYFIPIFWNPYVLYYKTLLSNMGISALRLHQRIPRISFTKQFLYELLMEDSFHYLLYSGIFFQIAPVTLVLQPILLFSLLHSASYFLGLLDTLGQNNCWGARLLISLVEFQSRNILRVVSFTEIFLMPLIVILTFLGKANILTPFFYYQFLNLRYLSRRNPYTRNMFHDFRIFIEETANRPELPSFIRQFLHTIVWAACWLGPKTPIQPQRE